MRLAALPLVLAAILQPLAAKADCSTLMRSFPPAGEVLPLNGRILLEDTSVDGGFFEDLRDCRLYLEGAEDRLEVDVDRTFVGQHHLYQAVLVPRGAPKPERLYMLKVQARPGQEPVTVETWTPGSHHPMNAVWRTSATPDERPPWWNAPPRIVGHKNQRYGCGWEKNLFIEVDVSDDSGVVIQAIVTSFERHEQVTALLEVRAGQVAVGRSMCSGIAELVDGARYQIQLHAVDLAGHTAAAPGPPLEVTWPPAPPPPAP